MLLGSFYQINDIQHQDQNDLVHISFNPSHEIFKGHFPHLPVVPGVCQIQILEEVISHVTAKPYVVKEAGQVKFLALLNPVKSPTITLDIHRESTNDGTIAVTARYFSDTETFFRFKGQLHA